ncbi:MAG: CoA transferase [Chloroflexi bacterium]|nr:CoA transferase [Chloroflexota bacterium]
MNQSSEGLPLQGVRIADFSWIMAGPTCTRYLGALGAEVIKVTSNRRLDPSARAQGGQWYSLHSNKRCCTINTSEPEGLELARRLVSVSDVLVENYGYGAMDRNGLGYKDLRSWRPDLIYLSSSGQGRTGPDKDKVAYGTLIQCYTGWSSITGYEGAEPIIGGAWTDPVVGMVQAYTIIASLYRREETGLGQYVDLSMAEGTTALIPEPLMDYAMNRRVQGPKANKDEYMAPHGAYKCRGHDEWVAVAVADDAQWQALCRVMGRPDLASNPIYSTTLGRWLHQEQLDPEVAAWTRERTNTEVMELLQAADVPAGASVTAAQLSQDPHLQARGFIQWLENAGQRYPIAGLPWRSDSGPAWRFFPPPKLGGDNEYVARDLLGLSNADVERLVETKVLY